jgi:membrane protein
MLQIAARHAKRALSAPRYYAGGLFKVFTTDPVFLWAQAIAFKTLVTLLPLLLLAAGIFGLVLRQENPFETVSGFLRSFLPPSQSDGLIQLVGALQEASGAITVVGALFFLVAVVTLFGTLRYVVGAAMGETRHNMRTIVGGILFDLRMMAQVGTLFLLSFLTTAAVRVLSAQSGAVAAQLGLDPATIETVTGGLVQAVTFLVPYVLTVGMLIQLYYFVPRPHPPSRSALAGAAAAAVLFEGAKNGFALYATYVAQFDRYAGEGSGPLGGLGGVFGLILAFVFWVYLSGLILVVGAVVAALHERRNRPRRSRLRRMWAQVGSLRRDRKRAGTAGAPGPDDRGDPERAADRPGPPPVAPAAPASGPAAGGVASGAAGDGSAGGEAVRA